MIPGTFFLGGEIDELSWLKKNEPPGDFRFGFKDSSDFCGECVGSVGENDG